MNKSEKLLKNHGLRLTNFRLELIELFFESQSSLSVEEIKQKIRSTSDKVTIYRGLDSFEKNGLIHKVPDQNNLTRYALCQSDCSSQGHIHNHAHFICTECQDTYCMDGTEIPEIEIPSGYQVESYRLTLEGKCVRCVGRNAV